MATITERVARGAALLDEKLPGWVERIDLDKLNLFDDERCVIGQLFTYDPTSESEAFEVGAFDLFGLDYSFNANAPALIEHGFSDRSDVELAIFAELTAEWKRVILARRATT